MEEIVTELLRGPKSAEPTDQIAWMRRIYDTCAKAPEKTIKAIAPPLKEAAEVLTESNKNGPKAIEAAEAKVTGLILQAQGLALHGYLTELNMLRNAIAEEASKLKAGSAQRKKTEALQAAYEQTIDALARAYNGMRAGQFEELKAVGPMLEKARAAADKLRKS